MNVTREDIIALCGLEEDEVAAIGEHEHLPDVIAAALGDYLVHQQRLGPETVRTMIKDDIRKALDRGDHGHAALLMRTLHHFVSEHPGAPRH